MSLSSSCGTRKSSCERPRKWTTRLISYERQQRRRESLFQAVEAYQRSVELSQVKIRRRRRSYFNPSWTPNDLLLISQETLAQSQALVSLSLVQLFRALAGGWQAPQTMNAAAIVPVDAAPIPEDAEPLPPNEAPSNGEGM